MSDAEQYRGDIADYVDRLHLAFDQAENHAGAVMNERERRLTLMGVGRPTEEVADLMSQAPSNLQVMWVEVPFTARELADEVLRVLQAFPQLTSGSSRSDGTGIQFTTLDERLLGAADPTAALGSRYPVTITARGPATPL